MALRRPPTAFALKPSDVSDLQALLAARNAKETDGQAGEVTAQPQQQTGAVQDPAEREKRERDEREARTQRGRVMGGRAA
ncbi:hypothetical protein JCM8547_003647 [Rhodosporidiobolus lusitaniae]